ncbi:ABC transporter ATP-binding protein [Cellulomonas sp. H30R-01]|uniref:ABC transporter ATP-binding protein n=1 Tax=Cellulomonas sp. H30R-01 TaxID=2704467 RepID=UPI00138BF9EC|nr:ABC transporter ATP-binding protein [Cellulomonas sp. H30R-01]QHT56384.1 ABC transporter ATP-binding protein [Cellulomonas sp. H30R-01]
MSGRPEAPGALVADVRVRRGRFTLDAALHVEPGTVVAVLGPNGAGKSTLLDVLAGLLVPDDGTVRTGDRVLTDVPAGGRATVVRPERRSVGLLGQDPLVFPHLTARENVAFAARARGGGNARSARTEADAWLARVDLGGLADRRPAALSGGQRQRVALARALAARPAALLLDEPFAQLDVRTAAALRDVVRQQVRATGTATVLVTHDAVDALTLADEVLVLVDGTLVERGRPVDVLADPAHPFTAALGGTNLLLGAVADDRSGPVLVTADGLRVPCPPGLVAGTPARLTFAPSAVEVHRAARADVPATGVARWETRVVDLEPGTTGVRVRTSGDVLVDVRPADLAVLDLRVGAPLVLTVPHTQQRLRPLP